MDFKTETQLLAELSKAWQLVDAYKAAPDCKTCANRGRIDGLSQETHCDHCVFQERWRTNHYVPN